MSTVLRKSHWQYVSTRVSAVKILSSPAPPLFGEKLADRWARAIQQWEWDLDKCQRPGSHLAWSSLSCPIQSEQKEGLRQGELCGPQARIHLRDESTDELSHSASSSRSLAGGPLSRDEGRGPRGGGLPGLIHLPQSGPTTTQEPTGRGPKTGLSKNH
ncbi:hypothetical protein AOLI_G00057960 [Acnodon oligacanthus]